MTVNITLDTINILVNTLVTSIKNSINIFSRNSMKILECVIFIWKHLDAKGLGLDLSYA